TERVSFIDRDGEGMFTCLYLPSGPARAGVVICPPLDAEMTRTYRREVLAARALARAGIAVLRFHYVGTGNTAGDGAEVTLAAMREDAVHAARTLMEEANTEALMFLGVRWGALVATFAAQSFGGRPVGLWEPVIDPTAYFRNILRARLMQDLTAGTGTR